MSTYGKVLSVETRNLGEPTLAAAIIGDTVLSVADASTFDETGGTVTIDGVTLAYTAIDADLDTITLAVPLATAVEEQALVELSPALPVKTALVDMGDDGDPVPATIPHSLKDKFVDGTRNNENAESVTLERRGVYEWVVVDTVAEPLIQASLDYVEGEAGYGLDSAVAQMQDAQVTNELGAAVVSAGQVIIGGEDLTDILAPIPKSTRYATRGGAGLINAGSTSGTTELRIFTFDVGPVTLGRVYEVGIRGLGFGTVAGDVYWVRLRYTTDGSEPTATSPIMPGGAQIFPVLTGTVCPINAPVTFEPTADSELRIAVTIARRNGTGSLYVFTNAEDYRFTAYCTDLGVASDSTTALQQTAKTDGSGADNPPITTKTLTWSSTHVESFTGLDFVSGTSSSGDINYAEIGWDSTQFGSPTSGDRPGYAVLHFNYTDIVSKLANATSIDSVSLKFTTRTRASSAGLDLTVFAHKYTSYPWNMASDAAGEVLAGRMVLGQGARNDCAPGSTYTIPLNTAVGTNLKSGLYKGVGFTTTVYTTAGLGTIHAYPSSARPVLIITFKSPA